MREIVNKVDKNCIWQSLPFQTPIRQLNSGVGPGLPVLNFTSSCCFNRYPFYMR